MEYLRGRIATEKNITNQFDKLSNEHKSAERLEFQFPSGLIWETGPKEQDVACRVVIKNDTALKAIASSSRLKISEAFIYLDVDIEGDVLHVFKWMHSTMKRDKSLEMRITQFLYDFQQDSESRKKFISEHYDDDPRFFMHFLGEERPIYSQYVFEEDEPSDKWKVARDRKLDYAWEITNMKSGYRVLEIGCGWGAFAVWAGKKGAHVTTLTIAEAQAEYVRQKLLDNGLKDTCQVVIQDVYTYEPDELFDVIVLMGVWEHLTDDPATINKFAELLKPGGYVYADFSASKEPGKFTSMEFINKHIFPGAHLVRLNYIYEEVSKAHDFDLSVVLNDTESYRKTVEVWLKLMEENKSEMIKITSETHYRKYYLYLKFADFGFAADVMQAYRIVLQRRTEIKI